MRAVRLVAGLLLAVGLAGCIMPGPDGSSAARAPSLAGPAGMADIALGDLPPEAVETLALIARGGPFPYRQDGAIFQNREGLLPDRAVGHYREYTVVTPGEDDRGARRIVTGADGERYWTADHYDSFRWIGP